MNEDDYFLAIKTAANPIFEVSSRDDITSYPWAVYPDKPLTMYKTFEPECNYEIIDYAALPERAFSKRVIETAGLNHIYGINLVPAILEKDGIVYEFYFLNTINKIACLDKDKARYNWNRKRKKVTAIKQLVLDNTVLNGIPVDKRLIVKMKEDNVVLYHKSITERIMATKPKGVAFVTLDKFRFGMC